MAIRSNEAVLNRFIVLILLQAESTSVLKKYLQEPQDGLWGGAG